MPDGVKRTPPLFSAYNRIFPQAIFSLTVSSAFYGRYGEWMDDPDLIVRAGGFHPWDAMAPAAPSGILKRGPFRCSAETGCGGSTIVLSHASDRHIAFAIEGKDRTITELRRQSDLR